MMVEKLDVSNAAEGPPASTPLSSRQSDGWWYSVAREMPWRISSAASAPAACSCRIAMIGSVVKRDFFMGPPVDAKVDLVGPK